MVLRHLAVMTGGRRCHRRAGTRGKRGEQHRGGDHDREEQAVHHARVYARRGPPFQSIVGLAGLPPRSSPLTRWPVSNNDHHPPILAGVELGGTKTIAVLARGDDIIERHRFATGTPDETLPLIAGQLRTWASEHRPEALGIASFGPLGVDPASASYGQIFTTTKPGWAGTNLIERLGGLVDGPSGLSTDVIAAALAEGEWGAARGCRDHAYITVGTGIGVGIVAAGAPIIGTLHPEAGHMRVARMGGDDFPGICAYHGDCLEGLASGPAIAARAGIKSDAIGNDDSTWRFIIDALAQGCANLLFTVASERITLGGGVVTARPWLIPAIETRMTQLLGGYLPVVAAAPILRLAELGDDAGPKGAVLLARELVSKRA